MSFAKGVRREHIHSTDIQVSTELLAKARADKSVIHVVLSFCDVVVR